MENTKYQEIETIVKALKDELNPVFNEVKALNEAISELGDDNGKHPLTQLVLRLTKTARRHNVDEKVKVEGRELVVGTNHQGLGVEYNYSSQLSPAVNEGYYSNSNEEEQIVRDILFDGDAVIDIASIIKKQNQKRFLKVVKILKKHKIAKAFANFKDEEIKGIKIDGTDGTTIRIDLNRRDADFVIKKVDEDVGTFTTEYEDDSKKPTLIADDETMKNIKRGIFISQNKEAIAEAIKSKRVFLKDTIKNYKKETHELKEILNPLLALEKL